LADGEAVHAVVAAEHAALLVDEDAVALAIRHALLDERPVVVIGNEANLLAVGLLRDRQPALARVRAHRPLRPVADGKACGRAPPPRAARRADRRSSSSCRTRPVPRPDRRAASTGR